MAAMNSHHSLTVSAVRYRLFPLKALPHFDGLCDSGRVNYVFCIAGVSNASFFKAETNHVPF